MATSAARLRGVQNIAAAPGFMGIIQQSIADVKAMKAETIRGEEDVQKAYGGFVKDMNASINAASKALAVLSTDDARDLFTRTFNPALLQNRAAMHSLRRTEAAELLSAVAQKLESPRLVTLTVQVRLDAFV